MDFPPGLYPPQDVLDDFPKSSYLPARFPAHLKQTPRFVARQRELGKPMNKKTRITPVPLQPHKALDEEILKFAYRRNPRAPIKELAAAAGCDQRTAESWWARKTAPGKPHLMRMLRSWGREFLHIFLSTVDEDLAAMTRLSEETQDIRRRIEKLQKAYEDAFEE